MNDNKQNEQDDKMAKAAKMIVGKLNFVNKSNNTLTFSISQSRNTPEAFERVKYQCKKIRQLADQKSYLPLIEKVHNDYIYYSITGEPRSRNTKQLETGRLYNLTYDIFKMKNRDVYLVKFKTIQEVIQPREEVEKVEW